MTTSYFLVDHPFQFRVSGLALGFASEKMKIATTLFRDDGELVGALVRKARETARGLAQSMTGEEKAGG